MYIVLELQTNDGLTGILTNNYDELNAAYAKFYTILAVAAESSTEHHTAMIITPYGGIIESKCFDHPKPVEEDVNE